jgi:hypothetical protein
MPRLAKKAYYVKPVGDEQKKFLEGQREDRAGGVFLQWGAWKGVDEAWSRAKLLAGWGPGA